MNKPIIPIFFAVDDNFAKYTIVTLHSMIKNASKNFNYKVRILSTVVSDSMKEQAYALQNDSFSIEFVDVTSYLESISEKLPLRHYYSKTTYYRLFIPTMYPELEKALYLDCDIAINDSISNLYNTELGDNYVGAIPDQSVKYMSDEFKAYVEKRVGVEKYDQYFNAGILVMNLKKLREVDFENKFIELLSNIKFNVAQDQDYLNVICKGHVTFIDETWNEMPLPVEIERPAKPKLIHYNLSFKPWRLDDVLYEEVFWNYARKTSFIYDILETKRSYTKEMQENTERQTLKLIQLTKDQAEDTEENARVAELIKSILGE